MAFALSINAIGYEKLWNDMMTNISDKFIIVGLQAHKLACGIIKYFGADRGGP